MFMLVMEISKNILKQNICTFCWYELYAKHCILLLNSMQITKIIPKKKSLH